LFPQSLEPWNFVVFLWLCMNTKGFLQFGAEGGILITVLVPMFTPSCPLEVVIRESRDSLCIHDATATACIFVQCVQTTPLGIVLPMSPALPSCSVPSLDL